MLRYFLYVRKSSEDDDHQMLSIDAQLTELRTRAEEHGLTVVNTFTECQSAKEPGRPVFNNMLQRIEAGDADAILCWKLDRLARNFDEGGRIIGMLQRGTIQLIRTHDRVYVPSDNVLMIAVEFGMANQYVRDLAVNIQRGIREKLRRGIFCGKAPLGYVNEPKLRTIEPHPKDFKKVKKLLEEFARGEHSPTSFQRALASKGLVGSRSGKPLPLSSIGHLLHNPFYYGAFLHKGELHQGSHIPMITKATYDAIQRALVEVGRPRHKRGGKGFLFTSFATCAGCGYAITAERHTKKSGLRFAYYRCSRKNRKIICPERSYVREEKFTNDVVDAMSLVSLPDEWREKFLAKLETWEEEAAHSRKQAMERIKAGLDALKKKLGRLNEAFVDGGLDVQEFKELKNPLIAQKAAGEQKLAAIERRHTSWLEPVREWIIEANQAGKWVSEGNFPEMKTFLKKAGSNRLLGSQTLTVTFKKPWNSLAETNLVARSATAKTLRNSDWWSLGDSNP
ncbi:hypothetical protein GC207_02295 [bacterium]|nr:hypothetical protein [bacterium]